MSVQYYIALQHDIGTRIILVGKKYLLNFIMCFNFKVVTTKLSSIAYVYVVKYILNNSLKYLMKMKSMSTQNMKSAVSVINAPLVLSLFGNA